MKYIDAEIEQDEQMLRKIWSKGKAPNARRFIPKREKEQRACGICVYLKRGKRTDTNDVIDEEELNKNERLYLCSFEHCPFHDMDKYATYGEFMRVERGNIDKKIAKALNIKVEKLIAAMKDGIPEHATLGNTTKWYISVMESQGYNPEEIAQKFQITQEQVREVAEEFKSNR